MNYTNCIVRNCRNRVYPGTATRFHPLPKDPALQNEWLSVLLLKTTKYTQEAYWKESAIVCGDHFTSADYDDCNRLLDNAVPLKKPLPYTFSYRRPRCRDLTTSSIEIESTEECNEPSKETSTNETNSSTDNNEAVGDLDDSEPGAANESSGSDSDASDNEEEIETIVEVEDDDSDVPDTIRGIIDDWEGATQTASSKVATASHVSKDTNNDLNVPETIKACRVCLALTGKMFSLGDRKHQQLYTEATGIPMITDDVFPQFLCWECAGRVFSAVKFRIKARAAKDVLMGILYDHGKITMKSVRSINRREHKLTSELSEKHMKPNDYINLNEVQLKNISDIMSNDIEKIVPKKETDVDILKNNDDFYKLYHDNDLILDRTLIDIEDLEAEIDNIDMQMDVSENALDYVVKEHKKSDTVEIVNDLEENGKDVEENHNDAEEIHNDVEENHNDVEINDNDYEEIDNDLTENDNGLEGNEVEENFDNKSSEPLWVGKVTKHAAWKIPEIPTEDLKETFIVSPLTAEEEISVLKEADVKHKCDICHRGFQNLTHYENHCLKHAEKQDGEECEICKLRLCNKRSLYRHKKECHGKLYTCKKCPYFTPNKLFAKVHRSKHIIKTYECRICSKKFPSMILYSGHMRSLHPCEVPCEYCGDTFLSRQGKDVHRSRCRRAEDKQLSGPHCEACDVTFASQQAHDIHLTKSSRHNMSMRYASRLRPEYFNQFTITKLTEDDEIAELQSRKNISARYKCDTCHRGYVDQSCYKEHILKHTEKYGLFVCSICKIRKPSAKQILAHERRFHGQRYSCKLCSFVTPQVQLAKIHSERHHKNDNSDIKYECPHCLKQFTRVSTYKGHLRIRHPCDAACEYCGHTYRTERGKLFHQQMTHRFDNYELPLSGPHCDTCDVTFATQQAHDTHLTKSARHVTNKASNIQNNKTGDWYQEVKKGYYYRKKKGLTVFHNVTCEQCNMVAHSVRMYIFHFRRQHPGLERAQYKDVLPSNQLSCVCEYCGKTFSNEAYLNDHMSIHTGVQFECDHCGKKFARKLLLIKHMSIHSDKREVFECPICRKCLASINSRHKHIKACHTNIKPYACEACGKRFVVPSLLRSHIEHVHNNLPWPPRDRRLERSKRLTRNQSKKI